MAKVETLYDHEAIEERNILFTFLVIITFVIGLWAWRCDQTIYPPEYRCASAGFVEVREWKINSPIANSRPGPWHPMQPAEKCIPSDPMVAR